MQKLRFLLLIAFSATLAGCAAEATLHAPPPMQYDLAASSATFLAARPGASVTLAEFPINDVPRVPYEKVILPGPQYLISDDPEYIRIPEGIALREDVQPGAVRLYVYNVNGVKDPEMPRRISAVIENKGAQPMTIRMLRSAFPQPSGNYYYIGKTGLKQYFESVPEERGRVVQPSEAISIDPKMEAAIVSYNDLVHGFYEFVIDQPAQISVVQTSPDTPGPAAAQRLSEVIPSPRGNAGRGVFGASNYLILSKKETAVGASASGSSELLTHSDYILDPKNGAVQLILADGKTDPWIAGIDGSTGEVATLAGNYGVMYNVELPMHSTDPALGFALVTYNGRFGSQWCDGMANTINVGAGMFEAQAVSIPAAQLNTKSFPDVVVVQLYAPDTERITFTYSPPGASCLPTPLVFLPVRLTQ